MLSLLDRSAPVDDEYLTRDVGCPGKKDHEIGYIRRLAVLFKRDCGNGHMFLAGVLLGSHEYRSRRDCIDKDLGCEGLGKASCEHDDTRLGNAVREVLGPGLYSSQRSDVDNPPSFSLEHFRRNGLRTKECPLKINVNRSTPGSIGGLLKGAVDENSRVVYQQIDPPEDLHRLLDHEGDLPPL